VQKSCVVFSARVALSASWISICTAGRTNISSRNFTQAQFSSERNIANSFSFFRQGCLELLLSSDSQKSHIFQSVNPDIVDSFSFSFFSCSQGKFSDRSRTFFKSAGYWAGCGRRPLSRPSVFFLATWLQMASDCHGESVESRGPFSNLREAGSKATSEVGDLPRSSCVGHAEDEPIWPSQLCSLAGCATVSVTAQSVGLLLQRCSLQEG